MKAVRGVHSYMYWRFLYSFNTLPEFSAELQKPKLPAPFNWDQFHFKADGKQILLLAQNESIFFLLPGSSYQYLTDSNLIV